MYVQIIIAVIAFALLIDDIRLRQGQHRDSRGRFEK